MLRDRRAPGVRLALAKSKADEPNFSKRRASNWFRCGRASIHEARRKGGRTVDELAYPTDHDWQKDLALRIGYDGPMDDFKPRQVPIVLLGPDPMDWLDIHLGCWAIKCTGSHMLGDDYRMKTDDELKAPEQARAFHAQGLDPSNKDWAEAWIGKAVRKSKDGAEETIVCDPLICKHFRNPDPAKECKPQIDFSFVVTWARGETVGSFFSSSWESASRLKTSVDDLTKRLARYRCGLSDVPCLLKVDPRAVEKGTQPAVSFSLDGTLDELAERARALDALSGSHQEQKALLEPRSTMRELQETPEGRLGLGSEFAPKAYDAEVEKADDFRNRWADRLTETAIDQLLNKFGSDIDGADAAAEEMLEIPEPEATEPPVDDDDAEIDAEFTVDDSPEVDADTPQPEPESTPPPEPETGWESEFYDLARSHQVRPPVIDKWIEECPTRASAEAMLQAALDYKAKKAAKRSSDGATEQDNLPGTEE